MSKVDFRNYLNVHEFETVIPSTGKKVKFKPITVGQLKKLTAYGESADLKMQEQILDNLISSCIIDEDFNVDDLIIQERIDIIVDIRRQSIDNVLEFTTRCPKCNVQGIQKIDLNNLENILYKNIKHKEHIDINDNIRVKIGHIKRSEQKEAFASININNKNETEILTDLGLATTAASIKEIQVRENKESEFVTQEEVTIQDKMFLLEGLNSKIYSKISNWQEDNEFGIKLAYKIRCISKDCGHEETVRLPMSNFFL